jgi:hypothetical protein
MYNHGMKKATGNTILRRVVQAVKLPWALPIVVVITSSTFWLIGIAILDPDFGWHIRPGESLKPIHYPTQCQAIPLSILNG